MLFNSLINLFAPFNLKSLIFETDTRCYAWALIPNHFAFENRASADGNGHAGFYNRRYRRHGHLFQNRYKSILCQADVYLKELGIPMADLSRLLKISLSAISLSVQRGEEICASKDYSVTDLLKL